MSEDENVPLLPSLEEEFDEDSDAASSEVTIARNEEGRSCRCTGTLKTVIFIAVGVALVVITGVVLGITLPLLKVASKSSSSDGSISSSVPCILSTTSSATMQSRSYSHSLSTTPGETVHTITTTSIIHKSSASENSLSTAVHSSSSTTSSTSSATKQSSYSLSTTLTSGQTFHTATSIINPTPSHVVLSSSSPSSLPSPLFKVDGSQL